MARFAIVLSGGRSQRMGTDKGGLVREGRTLLDRTIEACTGRDLVVLVAPESARAGVERPGLIQTLEDPPLGGPVAGIAAGLACLPKDSAEDEVLVLSCDLPNAGEAVSILDGAPLGRDGTCLVDDDDQPQYLIARYRRSSLVDALSSLGAVRNQSVKRLASSLDLSRILAGQAVRDVDTPEQAAEFGIDPLR